MLKLLKYLRPYKGRAILILFLLFGQVLGTLYIPTMTAAIVNKGIVTGNVNEVWRIGGTMLAVAVLAAAVSILETWLSTSVFSAMSRDIRTGLFRKAQNLTINEFNRFGPASMITRCTNDITQIQQGYMAATEMLLPAPIMTIAGLVLAFCKNSGMALLIVASMVVVCVIVAAVGSRAMKLFASLQTMLDKINRVLRENLTGIRVIRAFNRGEYEQKRSNKGYEEYAATAIRVNRIFAVLMPVIMMIMNVCTVLLIAFGGQSVAGGKMEIGDIMAMIEYAFLILMYLIMGIMVIMIFPRAQTCANRINEVLELKASREQHAAHQIESAESTGAPKLEFRHVTFQYQGAEEPVLNDISFTAEVGKTIAIIGSTGSGKSAIASLIPRFYDIQSGSILLDGQDVTAISREALRERIGFVPQKAFLFSGTILDNFRHGKRNASMEGVRHAAEVAQIGDFIEGLEDGYDTAVAQGSSNFSGGQRQRLAIARALVRKPEIYVFDDSFSALDFKTERNFAANQEALGRLNAGIEEAFSGNTVIKAFNLERQTIENVDDLSQQLYKAGSRAMFSNYVISPVIRLVNQFGYVVIAVCGAVSVLSGAISIGDIQAFIQYVNQVSEPLTEVSYTINTLQGAIAAAERVFELLDEEEETADAPDAPILDNLQGSVRFDHVRFGYSDDAILMQDISVDVKAGSKIAIVGPTGAGKTTLVNLLMRFYELQGGRITIDGVDIADMKRSDLRSLMGMVLQDSWLFGGTIRENIAYSREDATDEEIHLAAKAARADHFIRTLPQGYDTVLSDEIASLSQGQRQLLTIARAILADPTILILDEATSSVDTRTELEIQKAMDRLMKGRTSFVIAHRLSTIRDADCILVMNHGTIIEQGNHEELMRKNGFYAELYNSQFAAKAS